MATRVPNNDGSPPIRGKPATIYDVARRAKVSTKTVSKVVNNLPQVSRETRKKVKKAVAALSYKPNPSARSLASDRSRLLALLCDTPAAGSGYIARLQTGLLTFCQREGYHLVIECLPPTNAETWFERLLQQSRLAGAILTAPLCDDLDLLVSLTAAGCRIVRLSPAEPVTGCIDISIDNFKAGHSLTRYLIGLGHRRIGFITGASGHADAAQRYSGHCAALAEAGIIVDQALCADGNYSYRSGMDAAHQLLATRSRPTAIFAANDDMAAAVLATALSYGLTVPRDLSVVGFDDSLFAQLVWPRLTTCRQPIAEMAEVAGDLLTRKNFDISEQVRLGYRIVLRGTTTCPSQEVD